MKGINGDKFDFYFFIAIGIILLLMAALYGCCTPQSAQQNHTRWGTPIPVKPFYVYGKDCDNYGRCTWLMVDPHGTRFETNDPSYPKTLQIGDTIK